MEALKNKISDLHIDRANIVTFFATLALSVCLSPVIYNGYSAPELVCGGWKSMFVAVAVSFPVLFVIQLLSGSSVIKSFPDALSWALIIIGAIESVRGVLQIFEYIPSNHNLYSPTGTFYNPGPYCGYLAMILPVCISKLLTTRNISKYFLLSVTILVVYVITIGQSRASWLAAIVSVTYIVLFSYREKVLAYIKANKKSVIVAAALLFVIAPFAVGAVYNMKRGSADGRMLMNKISVKALTENPIKGCGWSNVAGVYADVQERYFASGKSTLDEQSVAGTPRHVFNEYMHSAMALGIPLTLALIAIIFISGYSSHKSGSYGITGAMVSLSVFAAFSYPFEFAPFFIALFLLTLSGYTFLMQKKAGRYLFGSLLIICAVGAFMLYGEARKTTAAAIKWAEYSDYYSFKFYDIAKKKYEPLYSALKNDGRFLFEYGRILHYTGDYAESNRILAEAMEKDGDPMILNMMGKNEQLMGNYRAAETWFKRSIDRLPLRVYPHYLLMKLYSEDGFLHKEDMIRQAVTITTMEPKVWSPAVEQMREEATELIKNN